MTLIHEHCYAALKARDRRFDGRFFVGVSTTRVYCRPICPARTPAADRCRFYTHPALAEAAGYRPCLRCRPELAPGNANVDSVKQSAGRIAARIEQGALNEQDIEALAREFRLSSRQLRRIVEAEYGVSPLALALTQRLLRAKQLLTDTRMAVVDVAFASGFSSLRQFNRLFLERYGLSPTGLRKKGATSQSYGLVLKLGYRAPLAWDELVGFLQSRGAPAVEQIIDGRYIRVLQVENEVGWIACRPSPSRPCIEVEVSASLARFLPRVATLARKLLDLDADPVQIESALRKSRRIKPVSGLRIPGAADGFETALRAVLGQQISVKAATTVFARFVNAFGEAAATPWPTLNRSAPQAKAIASLSPARLTALGLTRRRADTVWHLARACTDGSINLDSGNPQSTRAALLALPGIGPWTTEYIAMRVLHDPDGFPASDLGILRGLGVDKPAKAIALAEVWRPWRAYATFQIWHRYAQQLNKGR